MSRSSIWRRRSATRSSCPSSPGCAVSSSSSEAAGTSSDGSTVTARRTLRPSCAPSVAVTTSRSRVSTTSLVKSFGTARRTVSSRRPTSRASERKALCCTGTPSESRTSSVVRHSWAIVASATRLPLLPVPRLARRLRPTSGTPPPSTWLSTDCGDPCVGAEGVSLREAGRALCDPMAFWVRGDTLPLV